MTRTTVMLPGELKVQAARFAREMGVSFGELVRLSLKNIMTRSKRHEVGDSLIADNVVFYGKTPKDLAKNHDKYLVEDLERDIR